MRTIQLLQTKLQRPRVPRQYVRRPRLIEALDQGSQGALTLVCAPAGYGKTTLVSSWVESPHPVRDRTAPNRVAWLTLDERDADFDLFLRYCISALRTVFPDACPATSSLLRATRQPPFDLLCATIINELSSLPDDYVLVLDDYHLIRGTAVPDFLSELERHWPQPMHMVLISRHVPALSLASMRAKGQLTEIRARNLRFTPDEAAEYLRKGVRRPLSRPGIELLERYTEGWIAGLQLASISLRDADDPESMLGNLTDLQVEFVDYLANDVLSRQPAPILSFLFQTAVLESFSVALCNDVVENEDSEWNAYRCVDWIERRNLFIVSLDSHKEWYRYHQMFRAVLVERAAAELGRERIAELQGRAATWFVNRGLVDEAVELALAAGDHELASHFIARGLCDVLNREDRPKLDRWLSRFSDEFVKDRRSLMIARCFSLFLSWQLGILAKELPRAARLHRESGECDAGVDCDGLAGCVDALAASISYFSNAPVRAEAYGRQAREFTPESWSYVRGGGLLFESMGLQAQGKAKEAIRLLVESYESLRDRTSPHALRHLQALCFIYYLQGEDLEQLVQTAQKLTAACEMRDLNVLQSWGHLLQALAHYQRNELASARYCLTQLLGFRYTGNVGALREGLVRLALIHQSSGEQGEAWEMLQFLCQLDLDQFGCEGDETRSLRARLWLMRGELESAARWADDFTSPVPQGPWPWHDPPHLIKARILLARGSPPDKAAALEILDALQETAERSHNVRLQIEVLALRSLALDALGRAAEATYALQRAVGLAHPGGFVRVFVDLGSPMREALSRLARHAAVRDLLMVHRILAQFGDQPTGAAPSREEAGGLVRIEKPEPAGRNGSDLQPLIEPLTPRELELLTLLRDPLSGKEIARQLCISYLTAKRHTVNIYGKLGVNKRWAAVAKAEALGLIPRR